MPRKKLVWVGGKVIGLEMPLHLNMTELEQWEQRVQRYLSRYKEFQNFEIAAGARPWYLVEWSGSERDSVYILRVLKAATYGNVPFKERQKETPSRR